MDRLSVAVIAAWATAGLTGGVAASRALTLNTWLDAVLCVLAIFLGVVVGHWIMAYVVYRINLFRTTYEQDAPLPLWYRRLGIGLLSYILLLIPLLVAGSALGNVFPPFWRSVASEAVDVSNVFFVVGLIALLIRDVGSHPGALRTWTGRALCGVISVWVVSELYYRLSLLIPKSLPPLAMFIPAFRFLSLPFRSLV